MQMFYSFFYKIFVVSEIWCIFAPAKKPRWLVSNTSGATRAGSTPALGTESGKVSKLSSILFL